MSLWKIHSRVENFLFYFYLSACSLVVVVFVLFCFSPLFRFLLLTPVNRRNFAELDFLHCAAETYICSSRRTRDVGTFSRMSSVSSHFIHLHSSIKFTVNSACQNTNQKTVFMAFFRFLLPSLDSQSSLSPPAGFPSWDI